jgi:hypothetical protein
MGALEMAYNLLLTGSVNGWQENGHLKEEKITGNCWATWNRGEKKAECVNNRCDEDLKSQDILNFEDVTQF